MGAGRGRFQSVCKRFVKSLCGLDHTTPPLFSPATLLLSLTIKSGHEMTRMPILRTSILPSLGRPRSSERHVCVYDALIDKSNLALKTSHPRHRTILQNHAPSRIILTISTWTFLVPFKVPRPNHQSAEQKSCVAPTTKSAEY